MMNKRVSPSPFRWWRAVLGGVLAVMAVFCLVAAVIVRYADDTVLDTEGYTETIGALPGNPAVAEALGVFTADRLFSSGVVEQHIEEFLPPLLAPAAPLLSETLKTQVAEVTEKVVASQKFEDIWTVANRGLQENLLKLAHSEPREEREPAAATLRLAELFGQVRERFGNENGALLNDSQKDKAAELRLNLQTSVAELRGMVKVVETGAWLLPLLAVLLLAGALFAANNARRAVLVIGVLTVAMGVIVLGILRVSSERFFDSVEQPVYREAARALYEALYGGLHIRLVWLVVVGLVVTLIALLFGPYAWAVRLRELLRLERSKHYSHRRT